MKKVRIIIPIMFFMFAFGLINGVSAFPGYGGKDTSNYCHSNPAIANVVSGMMTEDDYFSYENTIGSRMQVPVAANHENLFVEMIFNVNETHLAITMQWEDNDIQGSDMMMGEAADGIAICWNINADPFGQSNFGMGMKTNKSGDAVDTTLVKITESAVIVNTTTGQNVSAKAYDLYYNYEGWQLPETESNVDVVYANHHKSAYGDDLQYKVVVLRELDGTDGEDPDFQYTETHQFMLAVLNNSTGSDHYPGFPVNVIVQGMDGEEGSGIAAYSFPVILILSSIAIFAYMKKTKKM